MSTVLLTLCLAALVLRSSGSPLARIRRDLESGEPSEDPTVQVEPMNPYDAGPVDSCETPEGDAYCALNYPIPSSLAKIAHIIEGEIAVTVEKTTLMYDATCAAAVGDLFCTQRFPRCSEDGQGVVFSLSEQHCVDRITSDCPEDGRIIFRTLCYSLNRTAPIGSCRPVTEYSNAENYQFEHCPVDSDTQVTEWQYELLKLEDARVDSNLLIPTCDQLYKKYVCQYVGRCWDEGRRIQVVNTVEDCEAFVSCYTDSIEGLLMELYQCSLWPSRFAQFLTPVITEPTTTATTEATELTTQSTQPTWPSAVTPPDLGGGQGESVGGGTAALHSLPWRLLLLMAAVLGLHLAAL